MEPISISLIGLSNSLTAIAASIAAIASAFTSIFTALLTTLATFSGFMAALASVIPPPTGKSKIYSSVYKFINYTAFNIKYAKNNVAEAVGVDKFEQLTNDTVSNDQEVVDERVMRNAGTYEDNV